MCPVSISPILVQLCDVRMLSSIEAGGECCTMRRVSSTSAGFEFCAGKGTQTFDFNFDQEWKDTRTRISLLLSL